MTVRELIDELKRLDEREEVRVEIEIKPTAVDTYSRPLADVEFRNTNFLSRKSQPKERVFLVGGRGEA